MLYGLVAITLKSGKVKAFMVEVASGSSEKFTMIGDMMTLREKWAKGLERQMPKFCEGREMLFLAV
jgi:hypothetical protein